MLMTCYHIDGDVENEYNIDKMAFEASQSSTIRISFADEDLLFVVGYIREQMVNRILIDDGSAVKYSF